MNKTIRAKSLALALAMTLAMPAAASAEPNLSGTWQVIKPRTAIVPDQKAIPFTPEGRKQYQDNLRSKAKHDPDFDRTTTHCSAPGTPRVMLTPQRFRIFQDSQIIMMLFEWNRFRRAIAMPDMPAQFSIFGDSDNARLVGTKMGTSKGHWEGDTLVVTTTELADSTMIDDAVPHGFQLKVTERIRLIDPQTLEDRMTVEDPEYFTKPWDTVLTYARQPDTIFPEDECLDRVTGEQELPTQ